MEADHHEGGAEGTSFGARLAGIRGRRSLREVARAAGISPGTLSHIEAGRTYPRMSTLVALARALGVPTHELVSLAAAAATPIADDELLGVDALIADTWSRAGDDLARELEQRRLEGVLALVTPSVFAELVRLTVRRISPGTTVLPEVRPGATSPELCLFTDDGETLVTPLFLGERASRLDVEAVVTDLTTIPWSDPARLGSIIVFASCAPAATRVVARYVDGLDAAAPGARFGLSEHFGHDATTAEVYCVAHASRSSIEVTVMSLGIDVTVERAPVVPLPLPTLPTLPAGGP